MSTDTRLDYWKRRARDAERRLQFEVEHNAHTDRWAQEAFKEQRRLADRLTFVYGMARAAGCSDDDLRGDL